MNREEKKTELAKYLEISPYEIQYSDGTREIEFLTPKGSYLVCTVEEADTLMYDDISNSIAENGIASFTTEFQEWILNNATDQDFFEDCCLESESFYAEEIFNEPSSDYESRFIEECIEIGIISTEDIDDAGKYTGDADSLMYEFAEKLVERVREDYKGNFGQWVIDNFGREGFHNLIEANPNVLGIQSIVDEAIEWDGYGSVLSVWDGQTIELDENLLAFKLNEDDERDEEFIEAIKDSTERDT